MIEFTPNTIRYNGNGTTTSFDFTFRIFDETDVDVYVGGVLQTLSVDYTVTGVNQPEGGTIEFTVAPVTGTNNILFERSVPYTQTISIPEGSKFPVELVETGLDRIVVMLHQLFDKSIAGISVAQIALTGNEDLAFSQNATERSDRVMAFSADGNTVTVGPTVSQLNAVIAASSAAVANAAASTLSGRGSAAGSGPLQAITLGSGLTMTGTVLSSSAASNPLTTKGDIAVQNATTTTRLPVGTNGSILMADSAQDTGVKWQPFSLSPITNLLNPIINGAFDIWQRGTTFTSIANNVYSADRWVNEASTSGAVVYRRSTNVPTVAQAGMLFNYSLEVDVTTADVSVAATDFWMLTQRIEGWIWRAFAQRAFTVSFWVMSPKAGTHCVAFQNFGNNRSYVAEYTVNVVNTWEYKTVTVSASPSAGTWNYETSLGLGVSFVYMAGSNHQTTAGAWQTGDFLSTAGQVNVVDTFANKFRITGVKMELGSSATPFEFTAFDTEFARCERYYQKSFNYATPPAQGIGTLTNEQRFAGSVGAAATIIAPTVNAQRMRATPVVTVYNPDAANGQLRNLDTSSDCSGTVVTALGDRTFLVTATTPASTVAGHRFAYHWVMDAEIL